jgi:MFS family permease
VGAVIGQWILGRASDIWGRIGRMALGVLAIRAVTLMPHLGFWIKLGVLLWGMGAISLALVPPLPAAVCNRACLRSAANGTDRQRSRGVTGPRRPAGIPRAPLRSLVALAAGRACFSSDQRLAAASLIPSGFQWVSSRQ